MKICLLKAQVFVLLFAFYGPLNTCNAVFEHTTAHTRDLVPLVSTTLTNDTHTHAAKHTAKQLLKGTQAPVRCIFMRHGKKESDKQAADASLLKQGILDAVRAGLMIKRYITETSAFASLDTLIVSNLRRAHLTGAIAALQIHTDAQKPWNEFIASKLQELNTLNAINCRPAADFFESGNENENDIHGKRILSADEKTTLTAALDTLNAVKNEKKEVQQALRLLGADLGGLDAATLSTFYAKANTEDNEGNHNTFPKTQKPQAKAEYKTRIFDFFTKVLKGQALIVGHGSWWSTAIELYGGPYCKCITMPSKKSSNKYRLDFAMAVDMTVTVTADPTAEGGQKIEIRNCILIPATGPRIGGYLEMEKCRKGVESALSNAQTALVEAKRREDADE